MIENILKFPELLKNGKVNFNKSGLKEVVQNYFFIHISKNTFLETSQKQLIIQNINKSQAAIISESKKLNEDTAKQYLIIGFEKTIIILERSPTSTSLLKDIFSSNSNMLVYNFTKEKFEIKNQVIEIDPIFEEEIRNFKEIYCIPSTQDIQKVWSFISPCISGYLIRKSYLQNEKFRIEKFILDIEEEPMQKINENEYVELRNVGAGSIFICALIYHIKKEKLFVVKKPMKGEHGNIEREASNYMKIKHPFIPKFYGKVDGKGYIVIEFIKGKTLKNINEIELSFSDKIKIVFELLMIFKYFFDKGLLYRDLKPDNVMIDENKTVVLIDFDRLIENDSDAEQTLDLNAHFSANEIDQTRKYSYKTDIFSLGKMIKYLIDQNTASYNSSDYSKICQIIQKCMDKDAEKRPSISELIQDFCLKFKSKIQIEKSFSKYEEHYDFFKTIHEIDLTSALSKISLGFIYYEGQYVTRDINKAVHYYTLAADQNYPKAFIYIATAYYEERYIKRNINKAIHYFSLAADRNIAEAQFMLGQIFHEGRYVYKDENKAIHYYTLAANQNFALAHLLLGLIYDVGKTVEQDIKKAIYHYTIAANQNIMKAQLNLGLIYSEGLHVSRDIDKAIHYFTLASNQKSDEAQLNLGNIFYEGLYVTRDINKAIHYYAHAADQGSVEAQFILGNIYFEGRYVTRDIEKAILYFTYAAHQKLGEAQFNLGCIFYDGRYIERNIDDAIFYFTLAADQNFAVAQFNLGFIYHEGKYVKQDIKLAIRYYLLAANQNFPRAQLNLGLIYHEGKYVKRDINKAIKYYTLAANQNLLEAQFNLGNIYCNGQYVMRDISKAIYYYTLAAKQNFSKAQYILGLIYYEGRYIECDIKKSIHYFTLAASQNFFYANLLLGRIYDEGRCVKRDINKAIYYYNLASYYNIAEAQIYLGKLYERGRYVKRDINKAIHYYTLAANQNSSEAQFYLGIIYSNASINNLEKSNYYIILASKNENRKANFVHGFLLHEGKRIKRDINEAIHYYKEASSFNIQYAKNNLGIIYKHGFGDEIKKNSANAIIYFEEAIRQKNDYVSMYNLAHLYLFDETVKRDTNKSIELLAKSCLHFQHSMNLLLYLLGKQFGFDADIIKQEIEKRIGKKLNSLSIIIQKNSDFKLFDKIACEYALNSYRTMDFLYDANLNTIVTSDIQEINNKDISNCTIKENITSSFYDGFGRDLL